VIQELIAGRLSAWGTLRRKLVRQAEAPKDLGSAKGGDAGDPRAPQREHVERDGEKAVPLRLESVDPQRRLSVRACLKVAQARWRSARHEPRIGVVEHDTERPFWLPYVEVTDITEDTERALLLGASVLLPPREGPAGWRSVLAAPAGATFAIWQSKT
jgi:hypothetical protein